MITGIIIGISITFNILFLFWVYLLGKECVKIKDELDFEKRNSKTRVYNTSLN